MHNTLQSLEFIRQENYLQRPDIMLHATSLNNASMCSVDRVIVTFQRSLPFIHAL